MTAAQRDKLEERPDSSTHNPDPEYIRGLIAASGLSQAEAARRIGVAPRTMRQYLADRDASTARDAPYPVQYALEHLKNPRNADGVATRTHPQIV